MCRGGSGPPLRGVFRCALSISGSTWHCPCAFRSSAEKDRWCLLSISGGGWHCPCAFRSSVPPARSLGCECAFCDVLRAAAGPPCPGYAVSVLFPSCRYGADFGCGASNVRGRSPCHRYTVSVPLRRRTPAGPVPCFLRSLSECQTAPTHKVRRGGGVLPPSAGQAAGRSPRPCGRCLGIISSSCGPPPRLRAASWRCAPRGGRPRTAWR